MPEKLPAPKQKGERIKIKSSPEQAMVWLMRHLFAAMIATSGAALTGHLGGKVITYLAIGEKTSNEQLSILEDKLKKLLEEKDKLSAKEKFNRWVEEVIGNTSKWLAENEVSLRAKIASAKRVRDLWDVMDYAIYRTVFSLLSLLSIWPIFTQTVKVLQRREVRKDSKRIVEVVNEHDREIKILNAFTKDLQSSLNDKNEEDKKKETITLLGALFELLQKNPDQELTDDDRKLANSLVDKLKEIVNKEE